MSCSETRQLTILAISDPEFLPRLKSLVASIARNMPEAAVHACLVNTDEEEADGIRRIHSRTTFAFYREKLDASEWKIGLDGVTKFTEKAGYCVNLRARALHGLLMAGHEYVLFMDADCIVRRELSGLLDMMDAGDIVIHKRDSAADYMRVCAALIGVRRTEASLRFVERLIQRIDEIGNRLFFSDQLAFYQVAAEADFPVAINHLPSTYIDWEFQPDSHIWTGKGQRKFQNTKYLEEENYYAKCDHLGAIEEQHGGTAGGNRSDSGGGAADRSGVSRGTV